MLFCVTSNSYAQSNLVIEEYQINGDTVFLNNSYLVPGSFSTSLNKSWYELNVYEGYLLIINDSAKGNFTCRYRIFPKNLTKEYFFRDTSRILPNGASGVKPTLAVRKITNDDIFGSSLNKTGSISRGISFGNNQNLSVNSNLNLQMSGKISPDISIFSFRNRR